LAREDLPRQRRGITPQMLGRYPDFDVLDNSITGAWDDATRGVVMSRLTLGQRALEFFTRDEEPTLRAFTDLMLAQDGEPRVPVVEMLDLKYTEGKLEGFQYEDVPDDRLLWHEVLHGLDFSAHSRYGVNCFADLDREAQAAIAQDLQRGVLTGGPWDTFNVRRAYTVTMAAMVTEFYSHPWAWNEIGFGGPAYPRGWMHFGLLGATEPFEGHDVLPVDAARDTRRRGLP
jgi:hypothetical protein